MEPVDAPHQENPSAEPIYDNSSNDMATKGTTESDSKDVDNTSMNGLSEPRLTAVQKEKLVYVNDRRIPIAEESLTAKELMGRAGYAPDRHTLYVSPGTRAVEKEDSKIGKPVNEEQKVQIKKQYKINIILKPQ
ncbi:MAG TPA: hypothetical protein VIP53_01735 [Nitrososphaera sp.]